jgi:hypothetical protein
MGYKVLKIDELTIGVHHHLTPDDEIYYLMEYKTGQEGYSDPDNNLIRNFKKSLSTKGTPQWNYKGIAMKRLIDLFKKTYVPFTYVEHVTLVPIPPSKKRGDPLYDDRITQLLKSSYPPVSDIRDLIVNKENIRAAHNNNNDRPSVAEIQENLLLDETLINNIKPNIILYDDVLTTGAHYLACKNLILERFPDIRILGMFIARRSVPNPLNDFSVEW